MIFNGAKKSFFTRLWQVVVILVEGIACFITDIFDIRFFV